VAVLAGGSAQFTIGFANSTAAPTFDSAAAHDATATLAVPVPAGLSFTGWTCSAAGGARCPGGGVNASTSGSGAISGDALLPAGNAAAGGSLTYVINAAAGTNQCGAVTLDASLATPAGLAEGASVQAGFTSPASGGTANNTASSTLAVTCAAGLSISKSDGSATYTAGGTATYQVVVGNAGPSTATGVSVVDALPAGVTLSAAASCTVQGTASCGSLSGAAGANSVSLSGASIAAGAGHELRLSIPVAFAPGLAAASLVNTATADSAVSDAVSASDTNARLNRAPVASAASFFVDEDSSVGVPVSAADADNDALSYSVIDAPAHGSLSGTPPNLSYTPTPNYHGSDSFTFRAHDGEADSNIATVSITVRAVNDAPVADAKQANVDQGGSVAVTLSGSDIDGDSLSWRITQQPAHGSLSGTAPALVYTPQATFSGSDQFHYVANDATADSAPASVTITVTAVNRAPAITSTALLSARAAVAYNYDVEASDPDGDTLTYSLLNPPAGMSINAGTGLVSWTPTAQQVGSHSIAVRADDGRGGIAAQDFTLAVSAANAPPVIDSTAVTTAGIGQPYQYDADASDADGDTLTYALATSPSGMVIDLQTGLITWTPAAGQNGPQAVLIRVSDGRGGEVEQSFSIAVSAANRAPEITSTATLQATRGELYRYDAQATDPDQDVLAYNLDTAPTGMQIDAGSGRIEWTPGNDQVGTHAVSLRVSDGRGGEDVQEFTITVIAVNRPPQITSTPVVTGVAGTPYRYDVNATDPDADTLSYRLVEAPAGMLIDASSGLITWTPNDDQLAAADVVVQVSDSHGASADQLFRIVVNADLVGHSHLGREFWYTHNQNYFVCTDDFRCTVANHPNRSHWVTIAALESAQGYVEIPGLSFRQDFNIPQAGIVEIQLPWQVMNTLSGGNIADKGVHVVSDNPVTVVSLNRLLNSTDAALIYPVDVLGTRHTIIDYPRYDGDGGQMSVVATQNNTQVTFVPPRGRRIGGPNGHNQSSPWTVTLQRGQAYQLAAYEMSTFSPYSGTRVHSSAPIAVFGGNVCANVPLDQKACDHLVEQILPDRNLGQHFLAGNLATRSVGNLYRFVATEDETAIYTGNRLIAVLGAGEVTERILSGPQVIRSSKPVQAWLLAIGESADAGARDIPPDIVAADPQTHGANLLDPFALALPPVGTELSDYLFTTPQIPDLKLHYVSIAIDASAVANLRLDGQPVSGVNWQPLAGTNKVYGNLRVLPGQHRLAAAAPFALYVYGYGRYESYGYSGGLLIGDQDRVRILEATPLQQTRTVGDSACFTLVARDEQRRRVPYARYAVHVDGPLPRAEAAYFDGTGRGEYCFDQPFTGTTAVRFQSGEAQVEAQVQWLAPTDGVNRAPVIVSLPRLELRDPTFTYDIDAVDPNGEALTYVLVSGPAGAQIDAQTGVLTWTPPVPTDRKEQLHGFTVRAVDAQGLYAELSFDLMVYFAPRMTTMTPQDGYESSGFTSKFQAQGGVAARLRVEIIDAPPASRAFLVEREGSIIGPGVSPALRYADTQNLGTYDSRFGAPGFAASAVWSNTNNGLTVPVFGRPLDTNSDGVVNTSDRLVALGVYSYYLTARFVDTGELLTLPGNPMAAAAVVPAFADLDNDGKDEILYVPYDSQTLVALNGAGQRIWANQPVYSSTNLRYLRTSIETADLDSDGTVEIIAGGMVYGANGVLRFNFLSDARAAASAFAHPLITDLDNDGSKEILMFNQVRRANGALWWRVPEADVPTGVVAEFAAFDFDGDGNKEVVAAVREINGGGSPVRRLERFTSAGVRIGPPVPLVSEGGLPSIFDADRDGVADIFLPWERTAYALDGSVRMANTPYSDFAPTHSTLLGDVNGDGAVEAFIGSRTDDVFTNWRWFTNRETLYGDVRGVGAFVDSNNDGNAEIFYAGYNNSLQRPLRGIWPISHPGRRSFRDGAERHAGSFGIDLPPAKPTDLRYDAWIGDLYVRPGNSAGQVNFEVSVRNRGLRGMLNPATVTLYTGPRGEGGREIKRVEVLPLRSNQRVTLSLQDIPREQVQGWVYAYIDTSESTADITPYNNKIAAHMLEARLTDGNDRADQQTSSMQFKALNRSFSLSGALPARVYSGHEITLQIAGAALDRDAAPVFTLYNAPEGVYVDPWTGVLSWTPTAAQAGNRSFGVTVRFFDGSEASLSLWTEVMASPNRPPVILSKASTYAVEGMAWEYNVSAQDPDGDTLSYALAMPPLDGMNIDATTGKITWTPTAAQVGTRQATLRVTDTASNVTTQTFSVIVQQPAQAIPVYSTVPPTTARVGCPYVYDAHAANAGGNTMSYSLSQRPTGMTIVAATGLVQWTPTAAQAGTHPITVFVSGGGNAFANQSWNLTVAGADQALEADIQATPRYLEAGTPVVVRAQVFNASGSHTLTVTVDGAPLALDAQGNASFTPTIPGPHVITAQAGDSCQTDTASVTVYVGDPADTDPPVVQIHSPDNDAVVTKPSPVVGTVSDTNLASWRLALKEEQGGTQFRVLASGTNTFNNAAFATFDPTLLINGIHILVLEATDTSGRNTSDSIAVSVEGDMKVGHYSVTFLDVEIPLSGIPIRVTRTYDTRRSHEELDFGYGWSVDYQNVRIRENRKLGFSWRLAQQGGGLSPWCVRPMSDPIVTITLPDGKVDKFTAKFHPECQAYTPTVYGEMRFEPTEGTHSQLSQESYGTLRVVEIGDSANLVNPDEPNVPVDPSLYKLTTAEGLVYTLDQGFGIRDITDQTGNKITYSHDGIRHSNGRAVGFVRDTADRIVRITLPDGEARQYAYTPAGDLASTTDPVGVVNTYEYLTDPRFPHYLKLITDSPPFPNVIARHEYDNDGRLIASVDANNKRIEYTHNIAGQVEVVKNRRGHSTTYVYDDNGWVLSETNALGEQTLYTYDEFGNELTATDPLGRKTTKVYDARGNVLTETNHAGETTTKTWGRYNQLLTETDPAGKLVISNQYWLNLAGEQSDILTQTTDALGNVTRYGHDVCLDMSCGNTGNLTMILDAYGKERHLGYDRYGNVASETDTQGNAITRQFDAMGRVLVETRRRLVDGTPQEMVARSEYDSAGKLIKIVAPSGLESTYNYDAKNGQLMHATVDGVRSDYTYTPDGRVSRITVGSGQESTTYDEEGNVIQTDNGLDRVTKMVYDAAGRLTETIYADTTASQTDNPRTRQEYDAAGQLRVTWDERSQPTEQRYDAAGRVIETIDALGQSTVSTYDPRGLRTSVRDALQRETTFTYNDAGLLVRTTLPDPAADDANPDNNPHIDYSYDKLNRRVAETDTQGRTTRYVHDGEGRLIAVVQPNPQSGANPVGIADALAVGQYPSAAIASSGVLVTRYAFNEQGLKTRQTDALGRVTQWSYDNMGRLLRRTLPLGQSEQFGYDTMGNREWSLDFNGRLTRYTYDTIRRLTNVHYADGKQLVMTYDNGDRPLTLSYDGITETRRYDVRDRVDQVKWSDGQQIDYSYDKAGNRTSVVTGTRTVNYVYDGMNRLETVSEVASAALGQSGAARTTSYAYDLIGNRQHIIQSNGTRVDLRHDRQNRLTGLTHRKGAAVLLNLDYALNASGSRAAVAEAVQQRDGQGQYLFDGQGQPLLQARRTTAYDYDAINRLVAETVTAADPAHARTTSWSYDAVGNRLSQLRYLPGGGSQPESTTATTYRYDTNDRLLEETAISNGVTRVTRHRYDLNGSLVETTTPEAVTAYRWNARNRLVQAERRAGSVLDISQYTYTVDGLRRSQVRHAGTGAARETRYLVDLLDGHGQVLEERIGGPLAAGGNVSSLALKKAYTHGDDLLAQYALRDEQGNLLPGAAAAAISGHFHYDALGSTRLLTDGSGAVTDAYAYHAYGELDELASVLASANAPATDYQYTGEQRDAGLGWYNLRERFFNPANGQFSSADSFEGSAAQPQSFNKYAYVHNDPANLADPSGMSPLLTDLQMAQNILVRMTTTSLKDYAFDQVMSGLAKTLIRTGTTSAPLPELGNAGGAAMLTALAIACKTGGKRRCLLRGIPTFIAGFEMPATTLHTILALVGQGNTIKASGNALPFLLQYQYKIRNEVSGRKGKFGCPAVLAAGAVCDEYPYASTRQGGNKNYREDRVSLQWTPKWEGSKQGNYLGNFYQKGELGTPPMNIFLNLAIPTMPTSMFERTGTWRNL
jgi:RHS repeat-associated protein/uncharacterized repeat protein (TIGR01451 family)